jgi:hypothetical protein
MNSKRSIFQIIGLTLSLILLAGCGNPAAPMPTATTSAPVDFTGHWEDPSFAFSLDLTQNGEQVLGTHVVVAQGGNKIDSLDNSIEGIVRGNKAAVNFQSSFAADKGTAEISQIDTNTIFWKLITPPSGEYYLPAEATLIKKAAPAANPSPAGTGTITGRVHLAGPPTPRMVVYAVDPTTGAWAIAETQATDGEAPFSMSVPPGTYQVFGAVADDGSIGVGYTVDYSTLATIPVAANQTVAGIEVGPPGQFECGATMGYPASPDGRFTGRPDPPADCIASLTPAAIDSPKIATDKLIRFAVGPLDVELKGSVISGERDRYSLSMLAGETLEIQITSLEGNAVFSIQDPGHVPLPGTEEDKSKTQWIVTIPADGAYSILVGPTRGNATYTLKVKASGLP